MEENKSIIIHGVDVSDCINRGRHNACLAKCGIVCDIFPDCYFKQLHRKTLECDELKFKVQDLRQLRELDREARERFVQQLDHLKTENERLKANNEMWKTIDITFDNGIVKTQISDLSLAEYSQVKLERDRAEQKLERIKDIANNYDNSNDVGHYVQDTEARHALEEVAQAMGHISQIIDEVE